MWRPNKIDLTSFDECQTAPRARNPPKRGANHLSAHPSDRERIAIVALPWHQELLIAQGLVRSPKT